MREAGKYVHREACGQPASIGVNLIEEREPPREATAQVISERPVRRRYEED